MSNTPYADWAAAGLVDTSLSESSLHFELHRTEIPQRRMPPRGIGEALDVVEHVGLRVIARAVQSARRSLDLE